MGNIIRNKHKQKSKDLQNENQNLLKHIESLQRLYHYQKYINNQQKQTIHSLSKALNVLNGKNIQKK